MKIAHALRAAILNKRLFRFRNYYRCCGSEWQNNFAWSTTCPDRCQKCKANVEPYKSEELCPTCGVVLINWNVFDACPKCHVFPINRK
jgi:hypothetical protein